MPQRRLVQIYPSVELRAQISAFQAEQHLSNAELVLQAIEATHRDLTTLFAPRPTSGLFLRSPKSRPVVDADTIQVGIRLSAAHVEAIDDLVSTAHAPSRSAYICRALEVYLATRPTGGG